MGGHNGRHVSSGDLLGCFRTGLLRTWAIDIARKRQIAVEGGGGAVTPDLPRATPRALPRISRLSLLSHWYIRSFALLFITCMIFRNRLNRAAFVPWIGATPLTPLRTHAGSTFYGPRHVSSGRPVFFISTGVWNRSATVTLALWIAQRSSTFRNACPGTKVWATPWSFFWRFALKCKRETAACGLATASPTHSRAPGSAVKPRKFKYSIKSTTRRRTRQM